MTKTFWFTFFLDAVYNVVIIVIVKTVNSVVDVCRSITVVSHHHHQQQLVSAVCSSSVSPTSSQSSTAVSHSLKSSMQQSSVTLMLESPDCAAGQSVSSVCQLLALIYCLLNYYLSLGMLCFYLVCWLVSFYGDRTPLKVRGECSLK